jgi:hypothetical protein
MEERYMKYSIFVLLAVIVVMIISVSAAEEAKAPAYVGDNVKNCKACHKAQFDAWDTWKMAKAYDSLPDDAKAKPECISCHVTASGVEGGFVDATKTPQFLNIQCEACHGPAGEHPKNPMKVKPAGDPKAACANCHNEKSPFFKKDEWKLDEAIKSIKHWKDEAVTTG